MALRACVITVAALFVGGVLWAGEGGGEKKKDDGEKEKTKAGEGDKAKGEEGEKKAKDDEGEKPKKTGKLTKEEKKALQEKMKLAGMGQKIFNQSSQFSTTGKGCNSCHAPGAEQDLAGKITDENASTAPDAIKKCLTEHMKADEPKMAMFNKNPKSMDALVAYLTMLKSHKGK